MPRLPDDHDEEHGTFEDYRHRAWDGAYSFWQSFLDFALRDNVLEVAVGLMYVLCPNSSHCIKCFRDFRLLHVLIAGPYPSLL